MSSQLYKPLKKSAEVRPLLISCLLFSFILLVVTFSAFTYPLPDKIKHKNDLDYYLERRLFIDNYVVSLWKPITSRYPWEKTAVIRKKGEVMKIIRDVIELDGLSGKDITGDNKPNLIITTYSGGAHCCFDNYLFNLGETLVEIQLPSSPSGNTPGDFEDLNKDGIYEFVNYDDSFAYRFCAFGGSPFVKVVLKYKKGQGYLPASPEFKDSYAKDIDRHKRLAQRAKEGEVPLAADGTTKCSVLPLVLDYLYSGRIKDGWQALEEYYTYDDIDKFRKEVKKVVYNSPYFTLPEEEKPISNQN